MFDYIEGVILAIASLFLILATHSLVAGSEKEFWATCTTDTRVLDCKVIEGSGIYINGKTYPESIVVDAREMSYGVALLIKENYYEY